jgi:hypothetical protein
MKVITLGNYPLSGVTIGGCCLLHVYYPKFFLLFDSEQIRVRLGGFRVEIKWGRE